MKYGKRKTLSCLALMATASAGNVYAAELEEIIVTAQGREQTLDDVPVSVSVVSGLELERNNITTLQDATSRLPNVKIATGGLTNPITIRGVGSGNNSGFEQSVGTFLDGVYRPRSQSARAALMDLERIEVLKGPQTTFFGANAIAGALNITTRKPDTELEYNVSALYGSDSEYNLEAGVSVPVSDTFSVRFAGRLSGWDSYIENNNPDVEDDTKNSQGRISMRWEPTDSFRSDLRIDSGRSRSNGAFNFEITECAPNAPFPGAAPIIPSPPVPFPGAANTACQIYLDDNGGVVDDKLNYVSDSPMNYSNYDFKEIAWTNQLDVFGGTLRSITAYFDQTYAARINPVPFRYSTAVNGYDPFSVLIDEDFDQFSQELRFESDTGGDFEYMFGGYYSKGDLSNSTTVGFNFLPFGLFGIGDPNYAVVGKPSLSQQDDVWSAFASGTYTVSERLRLNAGLRYSRIHKEAQRSTVIGTSVNNTKSTFVEADPATQAILNSVLGSDVSQFDPPKRTDKKFQPSVGLQYDITDNMMTYATYSGGFKAGGYSGAANPVTFNPETVDSYEIGLKGSFFDNSLSVTAAAFLSKYDDLQEATIDITPAGQIISVVKNAAASKVRGIELGLKYLASDQVTLFADIGFLDSKYTDYAVGACTALQNYNFGLSGAAGSCTQDLTGSVRALAPDYSGSFGANITVPLASMELSIDPVIYFSSDYFLDATIDRLKSQGGYAKFDLRLGLTPQVGDWQVSLIGKNLMDKLTLSNFSQDVTNAAGTVRHLPDRSRTIAIQLSLKY